MWSFDRVVAGSAYAPSTVQPVLHRYNDAKYVWDAASTRAWLRGFVRAHGGAPVVDVTAKEGTLAELPINLEERTEESTAVDPVQAAEAELFA